VAAFRRQKPPACPVGPWLPVSGRGSARGQAGVDHGGRFARGGTQRPRSVRRLLSHRGRSPLISAKSCRCSSRPRAPVARASSPAPRLKGPILGHEGLRRLPSKRNRPRSTEAWRFSLQVLDHAPVQYRSVSTPDHDGLFARDSAGTATRPARLKQPKVDRKRAGPQLHLRTGTDRPHGKGAGVSASDARDP
jgi:hypothetical protein